MTFEQFQNIEKRKHQEFFLPYYQERNWHIIEDRSNEKSDWDVKLEVFAGEYKLIDEKVRCEEYGDCLIELVQDLRTGCLGWFFGKKDWVLYGSWPDMENNYPSSFYLIKMKELREYVYGIRREVKTIISSKGWGITWNIVVSWDALIGRGVAQRLI